MSDFNTGNSVPSIDPRDLDDNATVFDQLLNSSAPTVPDRLSRPRKTWAQMEIDAAALVSPNVAALAGLSGGPDLGIRFTGSGAMATYSQTALGRTLAALANAAAGRTALGAMALTDTGAYAGSAAKLTTARSFSITGDATWTVSFDGSTAVTGAMTLAASGVTAGTYGTVTVNAKGLVTSAVVATPIANGGTGATSAAAARTALSAAAAGSNADITALTALSTALTIAQGGTGATSSAAARTALGVLAVSDKPAWTAYTPTVTASTGTFTSATATGKYLVLYGICHVQVRVTITTVGTGVIPDVTLPFPALSGSVDCIIPARESLRNGKLGAAVLLSNLTQMRCKDYANADLVTADGSVIVISGSYPIA